MEMLGLALAFPAVLLANVIYASLTGLVLARMRRLHPWLLWPSRAVLGLLVLELVAVGAFGAIALRQAMGPAFWTLHLGVVLLGAPALANLLLIPGGRDWYHRWYVVAPICYILGMFLVFFQVGVGDALFGPDGVGGPFSGQDGA